MTILTTLVILIALISGLTIGNLRTGVKKQREIKKLNDELAKKEEFYVALHSWLQLEIHSNCLSSYFKRRRWSRVAIYGMKELGQILYDELDVAGVCIKYTLDRNNSIMHRGVCTCYPDDVMDKDIDVVVVTAIHYYEEIAAELELVFKCPIISLADIIFDMKYRESGVLNIASDLYNCFR